jgi:hypothetical protein
VPGRRSPRPACSAPLHARLGSCVPGRCGRVACAERLIFAPAHEPVPRKPDGGLDWTQVTAVCILDVEDYHA